MRDSLRLMESLCETLPARLQPGAAAGGTAGLLATLRNAPKCHLSRGDRCDMAQVEMGEKPLKGSLEHTEHWDRAGKVPGPSPLSPPSPSSRTRGWEHPARPACARSWRRAGQTKEISAGTGVV